MKHVYCILISNLIFISSYAQPRIVEITHYLFPEFTQGFVLMKTGIKYSESLNYNSLTEEMIFEVNGKKLAISKKELGLVDTIFIKDRKFIVLNTKFIELIFHSKWDLYVEHRCDVREPGKPSGYGGTSQLSAITTISSIVSGSTLALKLPDDYETKPYTKFWLKKNGELIMFANMRQLKKLYEDKEDLFKDYVKMYDVKYDNQESIIQLIESLESN